MGGLGSLAESAHGAPDSRVTEQSVLLLAFLENCAALQLPVAPLAPHFYADSPLSLSRLGHVPFQPPKTSIITFPPPGQADPGEPTSKHTHTHHMAPLKSRAGGHAAWG